MEEMHDAAQNTSSISVRPEATPTSAVVWSPEDVSHFMAGAIHEAQKPLADALRHRPITTFTLFLMLLIILACAGGVGYILFTQVNKLEAETQQVRASRDEALVRQMEFQSKSDHLAAELALTRKEQEILNKEHQKEADELRARAADIRNTNEDVQRMQSELTKTRKQNEILRAQVSGLEMEKQALTNQLHRIRAMTIDEEVPSEEPAEAVVETVPEDPTEPAPAVEAQEEPPVQEAPAQTDEQPESATPPPTLYESFENNDQAPAA